MPVCSLHGVLMQLAPVASPTHSPCGILLCGESGIGKSHTALALLDRGHALIADDAPLFTRRADGHVYGSCPASLQDLMEVRGLGIINVRQLFGARALRAEQRLDLMIELVNATHENIPLEDASQQRLTGHWQMENILGLTIPKLILQPQPATTLALLVETAARNLGLRVLL